MGGAEILDLAADLHRMLIEEFGLEGEASHSLSRAFDDAQVHAFAAEHRISLQLLRLTKAREIVSHMRWASIHMLCTKLRMALAVMAAHARRRLVLPCVGTRGRGATRPVCMSTLV